MGGCDAMLRLRGLTIRCFWRTRSISSAVSIAERCAINSPVAAKQLWKNAAFALASASNSLGVGA